MTLYTLNNELDGIEIMFTEKPGDIIREELKKAGYRWHRLKKVWYAKQNEERLKLAESLANQKTTEIEKSEATTATTAGEFSEGYLGATRWDGNKSNLRLYGSDLSKAIREDIRKAGIKGVTVKVHSYSMGQSITATVKATDSDFIPFDEWKEKKNIWDFWQRGSFDFYDPKTERFEMMDSDKYQELTESEKERIFDLVARYRYNHQVNDSAAQWNIDKSDAWTQGLNAKIKAVNTIINAFRYDDSNSMVDYFDTNFYYDITLKKVEK